VRDFEAAPKNDVPVAPKRTRQTEIPHSDSLSAARFQRSKAGAARVLDNLASSSQFAEIRSRPSVFREAQRLRDVLGFDGLASFSTYSPRSSLPGIRSPRSSTQATASQTMFAHKFGKGIYRTPPKDAVYVGSHYTHAGHDASFVENGILPTYGENFGGQLEHGEGFYITTDADGTRWATDPQQRGHDLRRWDVYIDHDTLQELVGLKASDMPRSHKWQPLPYAEHNELGRYIDDYDYIVDEYQHEATKQTVQDIKFNPRALDHLFLVPNGFYDDLPADTSPSARYAASWTEYKLNTRRY